jgi:hypothetical protein
VKSGKDDVSLHRLSGPSPMGKFGGGGSLKLPVWERFYVAISLVTASARAPIRAPLSGAHLEVDGAW